MNQPSAKLPLKIGNAQAFWGDRNDAAIELLTQVPDLDVLTLDYLAEVSLSILAQQQVRDPQAGYARDFLELFATMVPYWRDGGRCKLITNAGGLNPLACAQACAAMLNELGGPPLRIGVVSGDAVLDQLQDTSHPAQSTFRHLESGEPVDAIRSRLVTANAYLGAAPLVDALNAGADIVITGRVADPSLTVAACVHYFQWANDDWDRWAAATVAGHLIECGVQVTGGISTDWLQIPDPANLGFPVIEMNHDGTFVVTKPAGTGGRVSVPTVTEQLLYEIGDPGRYLSPDLTVSFLNLKLEQSGEDRVRVTGAIGSPPSPTYKVSATYRDGYRAAGMLTIFGRDAIAKAERCGEVVLRRMKAAGFVWRDSIIECIGEGACAAGVVPGIDAEAIKETAFRIAIESEDQKAVEYFTRQMIPLVTAGPQGTTGYAEGRPRVHPIFRYWPCLIDRHRVSARIDYVNNVKASIASSDEVTPSKAAGVTRATPPISSDKQTGLHTNQISEVKSKPLASRCLGDIAIARSGDKGTMANIGIIARESATFDDLERWLTADRVAGYLSPLGIQKVVRYSLPNLHGLNFLVHGVLARSIRIDAQGKALGQVLLEMPLDTFPLQEGKPS